MKMPGLKMFRLFSYSMAVCFALLPMALDAQSVILGNLPGSGTYTGSGVDLSSSTWEAIGLQTSSDTVAFTSLDGCFKVTSIPLTLAGGIYSDNAGQPGSELVAFIPVTVNGGTPTDYTLLATDDFNLQANTAYWFVLNQKRLKSG